MAKTIETSAATLAKEARLIAGMLGNDRKAQYELYVYCSEYFRSCYRSMFFADEETAGEIFQNTFITLWEKVERRHIGVEDGRLVGKDGKPFKGSVLTFFMKAARLKYLEYARKNPRHADPEAETARKARAGSVDQREYAEQLYDSTENVMLEIISDVISRMSPRCSEILTKFYYEEKNLDTIMREVPTIESKDALKSKKHKCMETLRKSAKDIYDRYLNP